MGILQISLTTVTLFLVFGQQVSATSRVLYTPDRKLLQEFLNTDGEVTHCGVYWDSSTVQEILSETPAENQILVTEEEFDAKVTECHELMLQGTSSNKISKRSIWKGIYPGTKWCGKLNIAAHDTDIGTLVKEDTCCRIHDQCLPKIRPGETKYGLTNEGSFTAFHCEKCDRVFYDCMKTADTFHADVIGVTYFDVLGSECFEEDYPLVCTKYLWFWETCERDTSKPKVIQFKEFPDSYAG